MSYLPGKLSSEHQRALRAEIAAAVLVFVGLVLIFLDKTVAGLVCVLAGVLLGGVAVASYAASRAKIKAAAATPPAVNLQQVKVMRRNL